MLDSGYNPVNTITWALVLGVMLMVLRWAFDYYRITVDGTFILATLPFVLAGSTLRVVEDAGILSPPLSYLLITPLVYLLVAAVAITSLVLSRWLTQGYWIYSGMGLIWALINFWLLSQQTLAQPWVIMAVASMGLAVTAIILPLRGRLPFLQPPCNLLIILVHMLDASSTYIGVDWLEYVEKHVLPDYLIGYTRTAMVMYPLKLVVLFPAIALMEYSLRGEPNLKGLARLTLIILGLAPAIRNTLRMALGI